jgi:hypothetical protein
MAIRIQLIDPTETSSIAQDVEFPATKDGPWYRLYFPPTDLWTESEIMELFSQTIHQALSDSQRIFKIYDDAIDEAKGLCGWAKAMTPMDPSWPETEARLVKDEVNRVWKEKPGLACEQITKSSDKCL